MRLLRCMPVSIFPFVNSEEKQTKISSLLWVCALFKCSYCSDIKSTDKLIPNVVMKTVLK